MLGVMETPVGGRDYPRALREFNVWFPDEEACLDYLVRLRWPGGFACPVCRGSRFWRMSKGRNLRCAVCRVDASVTTGTIFADTRLPHKLRRAMVRPGRDRLWREVEVDESYVGGVAFRGKHGRGAGRKAIVAIAVEKRGPGMGRIRLGRIHDTSADSLLPS